MPFTSNHEYLTWEMSRWREHLDALNALGGDPGPEAIADYQRFASQSLASRAAAIEDRREAAASGTLIPLDALSHAYQLTPLEESLLLLGLAQHLSVPVWNRVLQAGGERWLEAGFAAQLVSPDALLTDTAPLEPDAALLRSGLLTLAHPPLPGSVDRGLLARAVQVPHYIASAVMGRPVLDERLSALCELRQPNMPLFDIILEPRAQRQVDTFVRAFYTRERGVAPLGPRGWRLLLTGPRAVGKSMLAEAIATLIERPLFVIHAHLLAHHTRPHALFETAARNAQMLGAVLLVVEPERLLEMHPALIGHVTQLIRELSGLVLLEVHRADALGPSFEPLIDFAIELPRPDAPERTQLWERFLPHNLKIAPSLDLPAVGSTYELTGGQIEAAMAWACQRASMRNPPELHQDDVEDGAKTQLRSKLGNFTERSRVRLGLDKLVLPENTLAEVHQFLDAARIRARVMNDWGFGRRLVTGRGLVALFAGEAGTGKTLTAEILANVLDRDLNIVSIPKIVSKWIGETEKNVREVFSQARAQNAILLFDEADSLFAKRVKVERASDHFQNMEVNNLLQEIERFDGIVILTTNLEINMDRAFERRILFKIEFPKPGPEERSRIWQSLIPADTPLADAVDFDALGHAYELTGGQIKNAIVRAAYACASRDAPIDEEALHLSAEQQTRAAGKLVRTLGGP